MNDATATLPLANGVLIDTKTGQAISPQIAPQAAEAKIRSPKRVHEAGRDKTNKYVRIGVADLPAEPKAVTTIGIVWLYYTLGLSDPDIADATGLTIDQVVNMKGLSLFDTIGSRINKNMNTLLQDDIRARIERSASGALDELEDILADNDVEANIKVRVAQDLLDRAGHAPKQITEHRHTLNGGLVIKHIRETKLDSASIPAVTIEHEGM